MRLIRMEADTICSPFLRFAPGAVARSQRHFGRMAIQHPVQAESMGDAVGDMEVGDERIDLRVDDDEWDDEGLQDELVGTSPLDALSPSELKAVRITSTFETGRAGSFGGLTGNFDGQGVSFGLMNFAWKAGSLLTLLKTFLRRNPAAFADVFGADAKRFQEVVLAARADLDNPKKLHRDIDRQMEFARNVLNDANKNVREPWRSYFSRLEYDPDFRRIQVEAVRKAATRARYWCQYFGLKTERSFAFMFDLVTSHGGAWLNAKKFKGGRRALLRAMIQKAKEDVGRVNLLEIETLGVIASMIADVSDERWRERVRARKLWFVNGSGKVHGKSWDLAKDFGVTDALANFDREDEASFSDLRELGLPEISPTEAPHESEVEEGIAEQSEDNDPGSVDEYGGLSIDEETADLKAATSIDEAASQPYFPATVRDRVERLLDDKQIAAASTWNSMKHPIESGIDTSSLEKRLKSYLNQAAILKAMAGIRSQAVMAIEPSAILAEMAHQFQQKIFARGHDGKIGEGTLDALGFVRHRGKSLNLSDEASSQFHVNGNSLAFMRIKHVFGTDISALESVDADLSPSTWYRLFVNPPFLGRQFKGGIHLELLRRLRRAERWMLTKRLYREKSPVEMGTALGINENHVGGRTKNTASMHTFGLAVDICANANPWVAGQDGSPERNDRFMEVSRNVSRLIHGTDETLTPEWLYALGTDRARTTESAFREIQARHQSLLAYLSLEDDEENLRSTLIRRMQGLRPQLAIGRGETVDAAILRWRRTIKKDRVEKIQYAFGPNRKPAMGFLNLHPDLVVALRDHGCLAWGAIDLGTGQSGDMMHFDCRPTGVGWSLALNRQRTTGAGHVCYSDRNRAIDHLVESAGCDQGSTDCDSPSSDSGAQAVSSIPFYEGN